MQNVVDNNISGSCLLVKRTSSMHTCDLMFPQLDQLDEWNELLPKTKEKGSVLVYDRKGSSKITGKTLLHMKLLAILTGEFCSFCSEDDRFILPFPEKVNLGI